MAATATVPGRPAIHSARPSTRGRVLHSVVTVTAQATSGTEATFIEKRIFLTNTKLLTVSGLRTSGEKGDYHSLWVSAPDGQATFLHAYGEMFHVIKKLRPGHFYSFEGTAHYGKDQETRKLTRFITLTKIVSEPLTVFDTPAQPQAEGETEEVMPL